MLRTTVLKNICKQLLFYMLIFLVVVLETKKRFHQRFHLFVFITCVREAVTKSCFRKNVFLFKSRYNLWKTSIGDYIAFFFPVTSSKKNNVRGIVQRFYLDLTQFSSVFNICRGLFSGRFYSF